MSLAWPRPPRSSSWKSKPLACPSSTTAGGAKANTMALRILENSPMARPARAVTRRSARSRRCQSLSLMKENPEFCPRPEKLMPEMVNTASTASLSCSKK